MTAVRTLMTAEPITADSRTTIREAAQLMREHDVGDILVLDDAGALAAIATDRDIVVRAVADGLDPDETPLAEVASGELHTVSPDDEVDDAISLMRKHAVRRAPVMDGSKAVGVVSLGDLAVQRDPGSALADVSAASPNT